MNQRSELPEWREHSVKFWSLQILFYSFFMFVFYAHLIYLVFSALCLMEGYLVLLSIISRVYSISSFPVPFPVYILVFCQLKLFVSSVCVLDFIPSDFHPAVVLDLPVSLGRPHPALGPSFPQGSVLEPVLCPAHLFSPMAAAQAVTQARC